MQRKKCGGENADVSRGESSAGSTPGAHEKGEKEKAGRGVLSRSRSSSNNVNNDQQGGLMLKLRFRTGRIADLTRATSSSRPGKTALIHHWRAKRPRRCPSCFLSPGDRPAPHVGGRYGRIEMRPPPPHYVLCGCKGGPLKRPAHFCGPIRRSSARSRGP